MCVYVAIHRPHAFPISVHDIMYNIICMCIMQVGEDHQHRSRDTANGSMSLGLGQQLITKVGEVEYV